MEIAWKENIWIVKWMKREREMRRNHAVNSWREESNQIRRATLLRRSEATSSKLGSSCVAPPYKPQPECTTLARLASFTRAALEQVLASSLDSLIESQFSDQWWVGFHSVVPIAWTLMLVLGLRRWSELDHDSLALFVLIPFGRRCRISRLSITRASSSLSLAMEALVIYSSVAFDFFGLCSGAALDVWFSRFDCFGILIKFNLWV